MRVLRLVVHGPTREPVLVLGESEPDEGGERCVPVFLRRRHADFPSLSNTGIAVIGAMLAAGLFEYNFGDSEFLMTFLVLITLPFAAARDGHPSRAAATSRA